MTHPPPTAKCNVVWVGQIVGTAVDEMTGINVTSETPTEETVADDGAVRTIRHGQADAAGIGDETNAGEKLRDDYRRTHI